MEEIAVLKACLKRPAVNQSWGFQLRGGADVGQPIRINAVVAGSPAAVTGLEADDEVTEVAGQPIASMTHQQVLDAVGRQTGGTLWLTVERKDRGSVLQGPEVGHTQTNDEPLGNITRSQDRTTKVLPSAAPSFQPIHGNSVNNNLSSPFAASESESRTEDFYPTARNQRQSQEPPYSPREPAYRVPQDPGTLPRQVVDVSGPVGYLPPGPSRTPFEFQTVKSRPFVEPINQRRRSSQPITTSPPQTLSVDTEDGGFEQVSVGCKSEYSTQLRDNANDVPQSRTFKILESIMSNEEPGSGVSGLPPPRSAAMERMKREGSSGSSSSPRMKVLMSQKYNSPLGMYSAKNLIETFAVQAENALETLEKQNPALPEHDPVHASRH